MSICYFHKVICSYFSYFSMKLICAPLYLLYILVSTMYTFLHIIICIKLNNSYLTAKFKLALKVEWKEWKLVLGNMLLIAYRKKLADLWEFIEVKGDILQKPVKDLDDVRLAMACLEAVRDNFIRLDRELIAIEEAYSIFSKFNIKVLPEDIEKVDGLRFNFNNLIVYVSIL